MMKKFAQRSRAALGAIVVGGLIGLLAAAAALGVAELVAGFTGIAGEPVIAVGGAAIDLTPIPVKDFAIVHFGSHDKTVLLTGIYAVLALFAMVTGILARRRIGYGLAGLGLFAVLGAAAAATRPVSSPVRRGAHGRGRARRRAGHGPAGPRRAGAGRPARRERRFRDGTSRGPGRPCPAVRRRAQWWSG